MPSYYGVHSLPSKAQVFLPNGLSSVQRERLPKDPPHLNLRNVLTNNLDHPYPRRPLLLCLSRQPYTPLNEPRTESRAWSGQVRGRTQGS